MAAHHVPGRIVGNLWYTVTTLSNAMVEQQAMSIAKATAVENHYLSVLQSLETARPGTSLAPLLGARAPTAQLPHGTPFSP